MKHQHGALRDHVGAARGRERERVENDRADAARLGLGLAREQLERR